MILCILDKLDLLHLLNVNELFKLSLQAIIK